MENSPLISVVVPCFNQGRYLRDAVDSLKTQSFPDWECIIVNDGSSDDTALAVEAQVRTDRRVRAINQPNQGLSAARNRGISEARGRYIQFLDADDVIMLEKFQFQLEAMQGIAQPSVVSCDYCYGTHERVWTRDPKLKPLRSVLDAGDPLLDLALNWEIGLSIPCHCFLFDGSLFREHGLRFSVALKNHEDWDCWMRVFAHRPGYRHVPQQLAVYRNALGAMSKQGLAMRRGFLKAIRLQQEYQKDALVKEALVKKRGLTKRAYAGYAWLGGLRNWFGRTALGPSWRRYKAAVGRLLSAE